ncbi:hypothetical protein DL1_20425 [Thioclava dalianensis]|uniref:Uncharacterized protein n=1 Tax=Thioclava dalianensis TaxID=1185766 RepID=A0A074T7Y1_9RHOB|nr:hypothetical protein [Thioclava dalianensis]KEP67794.1 hypothetical protein DL1_20425 [Thioclava dalianensis]SFN48919.1 hypothetical protein SAMN05216224_10642 [Thioclava dalianensis]
MTNPRIALWDKLEAASVALLTAMEEVACDPNWPDHYHEEWDDLHGALTERPRMTLARRDALSRHQS